MLEKQVWGADELLAQAELPQWRRTREESGLRAARMVERPHLTWPPAGERGGDTPHADPPELRRPVERPGRVELLHAYLHGAELRAIAAQAALPVEAVYRRIVRAGLQRVRELPLNYVDSPEFHTAIQREHPEHAHEAGRIFERIVAAPCPAGGGEPRPKPGPGISPYMAALYAMPVLTHEQEAYHFRKYNYLKSAAAELRSGLPEQGARLPAIQQILELHAQAIDVRNVIFKANLRLVVSFVGRRRPWGEFFDLVSDGNLFLARALETFDYSLGYKFSTYATTVLMKSFLRGAERRPPVRIQTGRQEVLESTVAPHASFEVELPVLHGERRERLDHALRSLTGREREVLLLHYGLKDGEERLTLEQIASRHGVSRERVRQIEARALAKLRKRGELAALVGGG